jgi:hypothetical protein
MLAVFAVGQSAIPAASSNVADHVGGTALGLGPVDMRFLRLFRSEDNLIVLIDDHGGIRLRLERLPRLSVGDRLYFRFALSRFELVISVQKYDREGHWSSPRNALR